MSNEGRRKSWAAIRRIILWSTGPVVLLALGLAAAGVFSPAPVTAQESDFPNASYHVKHDFKITIARDAFPGINDSGRSLPDPRERRDLRDRKAAGLVRSSSPDTRPEVGQREAPLLPRARYMTCIGWGGRCQKGHVAGHSGTIDTPLSIDENDVIRESSGEAIEPRSEALVAGQALTREVMHRDGCTCCRGVRFRARTQVMWNPAQYLDDKVVLTGWVDAQGEVVGKNTEHFRGRYDGAYAFSHASVQLEGAESLSEAEIEWTPELNQQAGGSAGSGEGVLYDPVVVRVVGPDGRLVREETLLTAKVRVTGANRSLRWRGNALDVDRGDAELEVRMPSALVQDRSEMNLAVRSGQLTQKRLAGGFARLQSQLGMRRLGNAVQMQMPNLGIRYRLPPVAPGQRVVLQLGGGGGQRLGAVTVPRRVEPASPQAAPATSQPARVQPPAPGTAAPPPPRRPVAPSPRRLR